MKVLYFHSRDLRVGTSLKTTKKLRARLGSLLEEPSISNRLIRSSNCLLTLVCVEMTDEKLDLVPVKDDVIRAKALLGVSDIIISAFAHLSAEVASPALARDILQKLFLLVESVNPSTHLVPFGWDKSLEIHVPVHHFNAAFRSFRND